MRCLLGRLEAGQIYRLPFTSLGLISATNFLTGLQDCHVMLPPSLFTSAMVVILDTIGLPLEALEPLSF